MTSPNPDNNGPSRQFPHDPSEFDSDPRISFSKLDDKFILETEDGQEFVYDSAIKRWVQSVSSSVYLLCALPSQAACAVTWFTYFLVLSLSGK